MIYKVIIALKINKILDMYIENKITNKRYI